MSLISERKKKRYKDSGYTKSKVNRIYVYKIIDGKKKEKKIMLTRAKYSCLLSPTPRHTILVLAIGAAAHQNTHFCIGKKKWCVYRFFFFFQLVHQARDAFTHPHTLLYIRESIDNMNMINTWI
jgi:hypothetical protein